MRSFSRSLRTTRTRSASVSGGRKLNKPGATSPGRKKFPASGRLFSKPCFEVGYLPAPRTSRRCEVVARLPKEEGHDPSECRHGTSCEVAGWVSDRKTYIALCDSSRSVISGLCKPG